MVMVEKTGTVDTLHPIPHYSIIASDHSWRLRTLGGRAHYNVLLFLFLGGERLLFLSEEEEDGGSYMR